MRPERSALSRSCSFGEWMIMLVDPGFHLLVVHLSAPGCTASCRKSGRRNPDCQRTRDQSSVGFRLCVDVIQACDVRWFVSLAVCCGNNMKHVIGPVSLSAFPRVIRQLRGLMASTYGMVCYLFLTTAQPALNLWYASICLAFMFIMSISLLSHSLCIIL